MMTKPLLAECRAVCGALAEFLSEFPEADITKSHSPGAGRRVFKHQTFIVSWFWRLEVGDQGAG